MRCLELIIGVLLVMNSASELSAFQVYEMPIENSTELSHSILKSTLTNSFVLNKDGGEVQPKLVETSVTEPDRDEQKSTVTNVVTTTASTNYNIGKPHQKQVVSIPKHSSSYRDTPLSVMPTVSTPASTSTSSSSSSSSSIVSSGSSFKEDTTKKDTNNGSDFMQQHPIPGGYKKRQLQHGRHPATNGTNDWSFTKQSNAYKTGKQFVPSPELVQAYSASDHHNRNTHPIDASYPSNAVDNDSRWFGANHPASYPAGFNSGMRTEKPPVQDWPIKTEYNKNGKFLWLPNRQFTFGDGERPDSDSPISRPNSKLSPAKGQWKWIPLEEESDLTKQGQSIPEGNGQTAHLESKIVVGHHLPKFPFRDHPYSFDSGVRGQVSPFSGGSSSGSSSDGPESISAQSGLATFPGGINSGKGDDSLKHISPWKKIIHVLTAAIPIGLIISALTPNVVYINPNMTQTPAQMQTPTPLGINPNRQRSDGDVETHPLFGLLNAITAGHVVDPSRPFLSSSRITGSGCEEKSFCELTRFGMNRDADVLSKMLWKIANETPADDVRRSGLEEIFRAVKDNDGSRFQCNNT
ncbi:uncharacterized protein LOC131431631 [Malaya genurostris]|uniref:uncharacterized protein LOC131431631 n=1 Tax=Malaya genurostris TaxID=325434 RepID=UPI0026F3FD4B|nr:uncharacterized protein LOC131431631 [Malaya genurostris]